MKNKSNNMHFEADGFFHIGFNFLLCFMDFGRRKNKEVNGKCADKDEPYHQ